MILNEQTIARMIAGSRYRNGETCSRLSERIRVHAEGRMPRQILDRRPNEPEQTKEYRGRIYVPVTQQTVSKVISSLEKIRRSEDWNIQYDARAVPPRVAEKETLERYAEQDYPGLGSLTNWVFAELLQAYLVDANGIVAVMPESVPENRAEYVRPVARFFRSEQIVDFQEGEYAVLKSDDTSVYTAADGITQVTSGAVYYILTTEQTARYEQTAEKAYSLAEVYDHHIGALPAFRAGGIFHCRLNNDTIYRSRIAGMIPALDEAAREYSDLQAELVQHVHSEKWAIANVDCPTCHGRGQVFKRDAEGHETAEMEECPTCHGRGSVTQTSPYGMFVINQSRLGEQNVPTPPMGYVQKDTAIAAFLNEHVKQHLRDALSAVNMEFLADVPLSQSGTAKAYDRDELNNFVNGVAEDLVRILDRCYYFISEYRYRVIVPDREARMGMLPRINVPTKYDILNTTALIEELRAAREAKVSPLILGRLEVDYAKKQFNTDPEQGHIIETTFQLDPLFGMTMEDKFTALSAEGVTREDFIVSSNIAAFVLRAIKEHEDFMAWPYQRQQAQLKQYAQAVMKQSAAGAETLDKEKEQSYEEAD